jgi:DNA-binding MarR family transcriptional regulator
MKAIKPTAYARFLNALDSLDHISPSKKLDAIEEQILNYVYLASINGNKLLVGEVIRLEQFGSQATLHGRLKSLVGKGYIQLLGDKGDARRKSVHITAKTEKHYQLLSDFLIRAIRS